MAAPTGAALIARALHELGVKVIFGLVGIPVVQIAEEAIALGIRFIAFRNEQAASYAATAYGYLTGRPGVCLVVGGPGVIHAMAGVINSSANAFPLLLLAGSSETHLITKGGFQEMDAISLLAPHTKISIRASLDSITQSLTNAYRTSWYGRAGPSFVDLPADVIQEVGEKSSTHIVPIPPRTAADPERLKQAANLLKSAKAPLIIVGKGAAYAQAETTIRMLVGETNIPFLPTPMGKGVLPDSHSLNTASARSAALEGADVVLLLGARLNWILHYGEAPKWNPSVKIIQVDISAEELGRNTCDASLAILGDINLVITQILSTLSGWTYPGSSPFLSTLRLSAAKNQAKAAKIAQVSKIPMTYAKTFGTIKDTLDRLSHPDDGNIIYVSEGANTMDISRSIFPVSYPRLRLDAGTHATMGVGLGYAIAAHCAYNLPNAEAFSGPSSSQHKKVVCLEGDSAFGFSLAEVETMSRFGMDILIFVINNSGVYHGDSESSDDWLKKQKFTIEGKIGEGGLRSSGLGWEVGYEKIAEMCGGKGYLVRSPEELAKATEEGFKSHVPVVVNVIIEAGAGQKLVSSASQFINASCVVYTA